MSQGSDEIVSFARAPLVEVVCGVQFHALPIQTVHFGQFWERIREDGYLKTLDAPPVPGVVESPQGVQQTFAWSELPELRRVFFVDESRGRLLQLQPNRFHHNWQRKAEHDVYPRFPEVRSEFLNRWAAFCAFLPEVGLASPHVVQGELTYINHIPAGDLWGSAGLQKLFPWFSPNVGSIASQPEIEVALHFELPECQGRLHVTIRTGARVTDRSRVVIMDLTVRGVPGTEPSGDGLGAWLGLARGAIVRTFSELTGSDAHTHWGREK